MASIARGLYNIGYIDVSTDAGKAISEGFDIKSTDDPTKIRPTFLLFGDDRKNPTKYKGKQDAQNMLNTIMETALETLQHRASGNGGTPPPPKSGESSSSSDGGGKRSNRRSSKSSPSKVLQLTTDNFEKEILNSPLVSAVACKLCLLNLALCDNCTLVCACSVFARCPKSVCSSANAIQPTEQFGLFACATEMLTSHLPQL